MRTSLRTSTSNHLAKVLNRRIRDSTVLKTRYTCLNILLLRTSITGNLNHTKTGSMMMSLKLKNLKMKCLLQAIRKVSTEEEMFPTTPDLLWEETGP